MTTVALAEDVRRDNAVEKLRRWRRDPVEGVRDLFSAEPDPWQGEVLRAFEREPRLALVACTNPGKTCVLAWAAWIFELTRRYAQGAATAITGDNLKANLWKELAYWYGQSRVLQAVFSFGKSRIYHRGHPDTWFLDARTWSRDADERKQGETLAGLHSDAVLFLLDEAGGIPSAVARTAENGLSGSGEAHVVLAGNPTDLSGPLYDAAVTHRHRWWVRQITGDPDRADRAPRVDVEWAREQIRTYGRSDAAVEIYVLGQFPTGTTNALVSLQQFERAFELWATRPELALAPRTLGVDVARFGTNRNVVMPRAGDAIYWPEELGGGPLSWQGQDTTYTSGRVAEIATAWAGDEVDARELPILIDDIGVGGGVTDRLRDLGYNAIGVNVGAPAIGLLDDGRRASTVHANLKSQLSHDVQERFRSSHVAIDPALRSSTLAGEGSTMRVGYTGGRRKIEGKEEYKRRTGRSPDYWDALVLSFADRYFSTGEWMCV